MNRNSIRWRLPISYAVVSLLAAVSLGSVMLLVLRSYYAQQEQDYLFGNALALQPIIEQALQSGQPEELLQDQVDSLGFLSQTQIRVLDPGGRILADSGMPHANHVVAVLGEMKREIPFGGSGPADPPVPESNIPFVIFSNKRESIAQMIPFNKEIPASGPAPQSDMILSVSASPYGYGFVPASQADPTRRSPYIANILLMASDGRKLGSLEFFNGPSYGADVIDSVSLAWLIASAFAVTIAALTGWFMSRRVTRPVLALERATQQMERGDLSVRVILQNEKQQEFLSLANSFNGMAKQVEQTVSTLRAFVADAAHELHTPLTALQANIELARDETLASSGRGTVGARQPGAGADEGTSERIRYLSRAQEQGQRLETLVKSLLDLSRIEAGDSRSGFERVDFRQLVREVGEQFASRAEQSDRTFTMDLPEEDLLLEGNETQLRQVVVNLLENALNFTPVYGKISLLLGRSANEFQLTVSDSGIGIPPEDLPHLFERFHRARNVSGYPGNGLGLAIVKAIVDLHLGRVEVRSTEKQGTDIRVSFPGIRLD